MPVDRPPSKDVTQIRFMTALESLRLWRKGLNMGASIKKAITFDKEHSTVLMMLLKHTLISSLENPLPYLLVYHL